MCLGCFGYFLVFSLLSSERKRNVAGGVATPPLYISTMLTATYTCDPIFFFKKGCPGWGANQGCQMVSFQTKNLNFGGSSNGRCWYILCPFGIFPLVLVHFYQCCTKKNLATLERTRVLSFSFIFSFSPLYR
jgi:hypothetical protein